MGRSLQTLRTTARLAWRDLRNAKTRSLFVIAALAVSMASISGVHSAAEAGRQSLQADSRAWLAGDLCVDTREPVAENQVIALDAVKQRGIDWTVVTTSLTMAASDESADPAVIQVKVVDPELYPFYGSIALRPSMPLANALRNDSIAVSEEVLQRLDVHRGDRITIAGRPFQITAVIDAEPDRFSNEVGIGLRCILSRETWNRSRLAMSPNPVKNRILLRLSGAVNPGNARTFLQQLFPEGNLRDSNGSHRTETALIETVIAFLSVSAFLALSLGALGVAVALRQHAEYSMSTFAIMKMLGARSPRLAAIFAMQIIVMIVAATAIGVPLGLLLHVSIMTLEKRYLVLPADQRWNYAALLQGVAATLFALAPVLIQPAIWIRRLRPAILLRRSMPGAAIERPASWIATILSVLLSFGALVVIARWMLASWRSAFLLMLAIAATVGVAALLASLSISIIRSFRAKRSNIAKRSKNATLRCAIANLCGPGNRSRTLISALAVSLVIMIATLEGRSAVVESVLGIIPNDRTGLYIAGFRNSSSTGDVADFVRTLPGVIAVDVMTQVRLQLRSVDRPLDRRLQTRIRRSSPGPAGRDVPYLPVRSDGICDPGYVLHTWDRVENVCLDLAATQTLAARTANADDLRTKLLDASSRVNALSADEWNYYYAELGGPPPPYDIFPAANRVQRMTVDHFLDRRAHAELSSSGSYLAICSTSAHEPSARVTLAPDLASQLGAKPGSKLIFDSRDQTIEAVVSAIANLSPSESAWSSIKLDCSSLEQDSLLHQAAVTVTDDQIPAAVRAIRERYPALAVITSKEIRQTVTALTEDAMSLARRVAWFAIAGGLCVLIAIVAASRGARMSEVAILSSLGAGRATIFKIYSLEFAAIGLIASVIASALAWGLTTAVLSTVVHRNVIAIDWQSVLAMVAISTGIALAGGWLPTFRLLFRKPMEVFRAE